MKRKLKLLLALVMSLTMVFGMSTTAFAALPDETPTQVPDELRTMGSGNAWFYVTSTDTYVYNGDTDVAGRYFFFDINGTPCYYDLYDGSDDDYYSVGRSYFEGDTLEIGWYYKSSRSRYIKYDPSGSTPPGNDPTPPGNDPEKPSAPAHVHNFQWQIISTPTKDADGLEGEMCSCGAMRNTQPISVFGYLLNDYAPSLINAAKPGQTITFEFGEWNSFPKSFMAKLVDKSSQNVTFVFHYKWNHVKQEIIISAGTPIDLNFDWYGPAKMAELYGNN